MDINTARALSSAKLAPKDDQQVRLEANRKVADEFEITFLTEMLKHSGLNKTSTTFGGGAGEDAFSSILTENYARILVESGGIGISDSIFQSIIGKQSK